MLERLTHGPLTVGVDATSWQNYQGGIIQYHCDSNLNHAVQVVGYDLSGNSTRQYLTKPCLTDEVLSHHIICNFQCSNFAP